MFKFMELMGDQPRIPGQYSSTCLPQVLTSTPEAQQSLKWPSFSIYPDPCGPGSVENLTAGGAPSLDMSPSPGIRARPLFFVFLF